MFHGKKNIRKIITEREVEVLLIRENLGYYNFLEIYRK